MSNLTLILFAVLLTLAASGIADCDAASAQTRATDHNQRVCYQKCLVRLRGTLEFRVAYGPPGYGETKAKDVKVHIPVIVLDRPIDVPESGPFMASSDTKYVQIHTQWCPGTMLERRSVLLEF